jgi:hypothetical protein
MPNAWIEHVRRYARDNNISYSCAVTEAKASYVKAPAKPKAARAPKPDKPMTRNYRKKVTPEQRERAKIVKQNILDRITY